MAEGKPAVPPGVTVAVLADGRCVGTGSDFDLSAPGGYSLREAQERRARNEAWWDAMERTCRLDVAKAINNSGLLQDRLRELLRDTGGWHEIVIAHGHEEG